MSLTVGPVIGEVAQGSARVLAEFDVSGIQTLVLDCQDEKQMQQKEVQANIPSIFVFQNIGAGQKYSVLHEDKQVGSFIAPSQENTDKLKFGVVSCNSLQSGLKQGKDKNLWYDLQKKIQNNEFEFLLHIGDQVYIDQDYWSGGRDCGYARVEEIVKDLPTDKLDDKLEECREILRKEYRNTWNFEPTKYCLANCPNRMQLDDHEVVDDAGKDMELQDRNHWKGWYSYKVARHVYYEYQKQLIKDIDFNKYEQQETEEYQQFCKKDSGFFVMDIRGHFLWYGDIMKKSDSYLGNKQKQALLQGLEDNGIYKDCKKLFFVSPVPILFVTKNMTKLGAKAIDDFNQFWVFNNEDELVQILDKLREWQAKKADRVVTIVGGDIHMGGHYDIFYKNKPCFKQLITSAMTSPSLTKIQSLGFRASQKFSDQELKGGYSFLYNDMVYANNFGVIETCSDSQGSLVKINHVSNESGIKKRNIHTNRQFQDIKESQSCSCCIY